LVEQNYFSKYNFVEKPFKLGSSNYLYKYLNEDEEEFYKFMNELYKIYKKGLVRQIPKPTITEVGEFLKSNFLAREVKEKTFYGLIYDDFIEKDDLHTIYLIDDPKILDELYTENENQELLEIENQNQKYINSMSKKELQYFKDENLKIGIPKDGFKREAVLVLSSKDGINLSDFNIIFSFAIKLFCVSYSIMASKNKEYTREDKKNHLFLEYLCSLWWAGFI